MQGRLDCVSPRRITSHRRSDIYLEDRRPKRLTVHAVSVTVFGIETKRVAFSSQGALTTASVLAIYNVSSTIPSPSSPRNSVIRFVLGTVATARFMKGYASKEARGMEIASNHPSGRASPLGS
jgi:hypothetical protein